SPPLTLGPPRHGRLGWRLGSDGRQTIDVELDDGSTIALPSASPWYVDPAEHAVGPIALDCARPLVRIALSAPPVTTAQAAAVGAGSAGGFRTTRCRYLLRRRWGGRSNSLRLSRWPRRLAQLCLRSGAAARTRGLADRCRGHLPPSRRRRRPRVDGRVRGRGR